MLLPHLDMPNLNAYELLFWFLCLIVSLLVYVSFVETVSSSKRRKKSAENRPKHYNKRTHPPYHISSIRACLDDIVNNSQRDDRVKTSIQAPKFPGVGVTSLANRLFSEPVQYRSPPVPRPFDSPSRTENNASLKDAATEVCNSKTAQTSAQAELNLNSKPQILSRTSEAVPTSEHIENVDRPSEELPLSISDEVQSYEFDSSGRSKRCVLCTNCYCRTHGLDAPTLEKRIPAHDDLAKEMASMLAHTKGQNEALKDNVASLRKNVIDLRLIYKSAKDGLEAANKYNMLLNQKNYMTIHRNQELVAAVEMEKQCSERNTKQIVVYENTVNNLVNESRDLRTSLQTAREALRTNTQHQIVKQKEITSLKGFIVELQDQLKQERTAALSYSLKEAARSRTAVEIERAHIQQLESTVEQERNRSKTDREALCLSEQLTAANLAEKDKEIEKHKNEALEIFHELAILQVTIRFNLGLDALLVIRKYTSEELTVLATKGAEEIDRVYQLHLRALAKNCEDDVAEDADTRLRLFMAKVLDPRLDCSREQIVTNRILEPVSDDEDEDDENDDPKTGKLRVTCNDSSNNKKTTTEPTVKDPETSSPATSDEFTDDVRSASSSRSSSFGSMGSMDSLHEFEELTAQR